MEEALQNIVLHCPKSTKSPYEAPMMTLYVGNRVFMIPKSSVDNHKRTRLSEYPTWDINAVDLSHLDGDIGHTLTHYLCTGEYQTLKPVPGTVATEEVIEYRRAAHAYHAAYELDLHGLAAQAREVIDRLKSKFSLSETLKIAHEVLPKLPENAWWFRQMVKNKLAEAFDADEDLFEKKEIQNLLGSNPAFDKLLVNWMADIYRLKLSAVRCDAKKSVCANCQNLPNVNNPLYNPATVMPPVTLPAPSWSADPWPTSGRRIDPNGPRVVNGWIESPSPENETAFTPEDDFSSYAAHWNLGGSCNPYGSRPRFGAIGCNW